MDFQAIAINVVGALVPYFVKIGERTAEKIGEKLPDKISELYETIKKKFRGDSYAEESLRRVESKPEIKTRKENLKDVIAEKLEEDKKFTVQIQKLLEEIKSSPSSPASVQQNVVNNGGKIGNVVQIGQIEGDIKISKLKS